MTDVEVVLFEWSMEKKKKRSKRFFNFGWWTHHGRVDPPKDAIWFLLEEIFLEERICLTYLGISLFWRNIS
jgi:hypothetical protein